MTAEEMSKKVCPFLSIPVPVQGAIGLSGQRETRVSILRVRCIGEECVSFVQDADGVVGNVRCAACSSENR